MGYLVDIALPPSRRTTLSIQGQATADNKHLHCIGIGLCLPPCASIYFHIASSYSKRIVLYVLLSTRNCLNFFFLEYNYIPRRKPAVVQTTVWRSPSMLARFPILFPSSYRRFVSAGSVRPHASLSVSFVISGTIPLSLVSLSSLRTLKVSGNVNLKSE